MAAHTPVLLAEVMSLFAPQPGDRLLDATVGHGGHAKAFLEATGPTGTVVGLDADAAALAVAKENLAVFGDRAKLVQMNFGEMKDSDDGGGILPAEQEPREAATAEWGKPQLFTHILFDLGIGSHQLADSARGFSFTSADSLSMRYGQGELPAAQCNCLNVLQRRIGNYPDVPDILQYLSETDLAEVIRTYGEERYARRIVAAITAPPLATTSAQLAQKIAAAVPAAYAHGRIHPATRTFQALRLAVNRELEVLTAALPQAMQLVIPGGKVGVISFHSLEDRIVKHFFKKLVSTCSCPPEQPECTCDRQPELRLLTKRPVRAGAEEVGRNPRSRSAKLRVAQKIGGRESRLRTGSRQRR